MINLPRNTEKKVVTLKHKKETWVVNPNISCPFCPNGKIWTRVSICSIHSPIKSYPNDPHFCSQCGFRFVTHQLVVPDENREGEDNQKRVEVLGKNHQLNIPVFEDMFWEERKRATQI